MPESRRSVDPGSVDDRHSLVEYLSQSLVDEYYFREEGRIVRQEATFLKTYLVELHGRSDEGGPLQNLAGFSVSPTAEPSLWRLRDRSGCHFFLDALDRRFPLLHTIDKSEATDQAVKRLVGSSPRIDGVWMPSKMLLATRLGHLIGFRFFFQRTLSGLEGSEQALRLARELGRPEPPAFKMHVKEYVSAEEDLNLLRRETHFGTRSAIESLNWRTVDLDTDSFIHNDVWFSGKVSAYGTSWEHHLANVMTLRERYASTVRFIEENLALQDSDRGLSGQTIRFRFSGPPVRDVGSLAEDLVKPAGAFRLLGSYSAIGNDHVAVEAVDLHSLDRLSLDLGPREVILFLRGRACANAVLRLLVHLERYVAAEVSTSVDDLLVGSAR